MQQANVCRLAPVLAAAFCLTGWGARAQSPSIDGRWLSSNGERVVEIAACENGAAGRCGTVIWLRSPTDTSGVPIKDIANSNAVLKRRPICELQILTEFSSSVSGGWSGQIYDLDEGRTTRGVLKLEGDVLVLNFDRETPDSQAVIAQVWSRMSRPFARCSPR